MMSGPYRLVEISEEQTLRECHEAGKLPARELPSHVILHNEAFRIVDSTHEGKAEVILCRGVKVNDKFYCSAAFRSLEVKKAEVLIAVTSKY